MKRFRRKGGGFLYVAVGEKYVREALYSIESLRAHGNWLPIMLFSDRKLDRQLPGVRVSPIRPSENPHLDKVTHLAHTPFRRTVFLDTDTVIVDQIRELFGLVKQFDLAAAHAPGRGLYDGRVSVAFYQLNSGVIAYRWSWRMKGFLSHWRDECWRGMTQGEHKHDQPAFRLCLWRSRLRLYVLPAEYNYRTSHPGFLRHKAKIFHGRPPDWAKVIETVNSRVGSRTFDSFERVPGCLPVS